MWLDLSAIEERAREKLEAATYDFYAGGSGEEQTLAANVEAWRALALRPRVLCDVGAVSTETTVLGTTIATPVLVAPTAAQRLLHPEGERGTRRGAAEAGSLMVVSTRSSVPLTEVASAADGPWWLQVYVLRDRGLTQDLVVRAVDAGCSGLVLTGDTPMVARKRRDPRGEFQVFSDYFTAGLSPPNGDSVLEADRAEQDPCITFDAVAWLREIADVPIVVKGVLRGDDAKRCVGAGAAGIVVSNHGGRQLDGAIAAARALPEVVEAVGDGAEVYVDGGIRRGVDVVRALALGARAVLVGRPAAWGLALGGAEGVRDVLETFQVEVAEALALAGVASSRAVGADLVVRG